MAAAFAGQIGDLRFDPLEVRDLGADVVDQDLARRRKAHAAGEALEDPDAEFVLDGEDSPVERGGRYREHVGRPADRARPGDGVDVAQLLKMPHRFPAP